MIIVSQNGENIIVFGNTEIIFLKQEEIWYQGIYGEGYQIAVYATKERAKEVLQEIYQAYTVMKLVNIPDMKFERAITADELKECIAYKMPKG